MQIANKTPLNRRYFLKTAGIGIVAVATLLWNRMVVTEKEFAKNRKLVIPFNPNQNLHFHEEFIIINDQGQTRVFSSHCTHLGCVINKSHNGQLLCPCHGSTFDMTGKPLKGPAIRPLEEKVFSINQSMNQITIEV